MERAGAAVHGHAVRGAVLCGKFFLEALNVGAEHVDRVFEHAEHGLVDLALDRAILGVEVEELDGHAGTFASGRWVAGMARRELEIDRRAIVAHRDVGRLEDADELEAGPAVGDRLLLAADAGGEMRGLDRERFGVGHFR